MRNCVYSLIASLASCVWQMLWREHVRCTVLYCAVCAVATFLPTALTGKVLQSVVSILAFKTSDI